jgi:hypothetical protein
LYLRQHYHFGPGKIASAALTEDRYRTPLASETAIEDRCWNQPAPNGEATRLTTLLRIRRTVVFTPRWRIRHSRLWTALARFTRSPCPPRTEF